MPARWAAADPKIDVQPLSTGHLVIQSAKKHDWNLDVSKEQHQARIVDQFTRQATPFNSAPTITDKDALSMLLKAGQTTPDDTVLDVACGGGIVVCAFARHVKRATGIDLTPAMIEMARKLADQEQLNNVTWTQGDVTALPYADRSFSIVVTRFSFHHLLNPLTVLKEMVRVCSPGGRIIVSDMYASEDAHKAARWNRLETLRDPSHVRCLALSELKQLFAEVRLPAPYTVLYELSDSVTALLGRSYPKAGDTEKIRQMFASALDDDGLGIMVTREHGELWYHYPVAILSAANQP